LDGPGEGLPLGPINVCRLFQVTTTGSLTLQNLTLRGGTALGAPGGGGGSAGLGGAIENQGNLSIIGCTLTGNLALGGSVSNTKGGGAGLGVSGDSTGHGGGPN